MERNEGEEGEREAALTTSPPSFLSIDLLTTSLPSSSPSYSLPLSLLLHPHSSPSILLTTSLLSVILTPSLLSVILTTSLPPSSQSSSS
jgi:hypothetical protein